MGTISMSVLAGVVGMGLGGVITVIFGAKTDRMVSIFLALASGVMVSIVLLKLVPEAMEHAGVVVSSVGLVLGVLMVMVLHKFIDVSGGKGAKTKMHESHAEFFHADLLTGKNEKKSGMLRSGMVMLFAIALHNVPEGLAMGAAGYHESALAITLALMIGLHNIPEGMAISAPLVTGGMSRAKTLLLVMLTGATTVVGAAAGMLIGGISRVTLALSFSAAGGAMLYVVFGEILPHSIVNTKDRLPAIFALVGIMLGLVFSQI